MPIGDDISQPIPPVGTAGTGYASQIVAFLTEIKARLEAKVALTSLLAGLFDLSNNGIANAKYLGLYEQLSLPSTPIGSLQRYGGELYYVSPSGAVRITNAGSLDIVAANGITGDYAAPAEFRYDLAALEYFAYSNQAAGEWARVGAQGFDVYGTLAGTTRVRLAWAGGANPSYTLTLPATLPGTQQIQQLTNAGQVVASNTIAEAITMAVGKDIVLQASGTSGWIKHGDEDTPQVIVSDYCPTGSVSTGVGGGSGVRSLAIAAASTTFYCKLAPISKNRRLKSFTIKAPNYESGSGNCTYDLVKLSPANADFTSVLSAAVVQGNTGTDVVLTPNGGSYNIGQADQLFVKIVTPAATSVSFGTGFQKWDRV